MTFFRDFILPNGKPVTEESVYSDIPIYNELIKTLKMIAQVSISSTFYERLFHTKGNRETFSSYLSAL